jgi:hypothetical protein
MKVHIYRYKGRYHVLIKDPDEIGEERARLECITAEFLERLQQERDGALLNCHT